MQAKEDSLKARYVKTLERHHQVMVQIQTRKFSTLWDCSDVVTEVLDYGQYAVKVAGIGLFLREYKPNTLHTVHC